MSRGKLTVDDLRTKKEKGEPIAWITAYDFPLAYASERAGVDLILVGDSGGMVQLGYEKTNLVTMDEMIMLTRAARRGAPDTFLIGDMPEGTYEKDPDTAVANAERFRDAGCDAVKLEGGRRVQSQVSAIVDAGIPVFGHLGLTPQSADVYRVKGRTRESFNEILEESNILEDAGTAAILLEAMPSARAGAIAAARKAPIYGIGAGNQVDGQLLIVHDVLGFYEPFRPLFAKCFVPSVVGGFTTTLPSADELQRFGRNTRKDGFLELARLAIQQYVDEVRAGAFPGPDYCYAPGPPD